MPPLFKTHNQSTLSDQQIEALIRDLARGRLGTMQEDYQALKRTLRRMDRPLSPRRSFATLSG